MNSFFTAREYAGGAGIAEKKKIFNHGFHGWERIRNKIKFEMDQSK
jgi:hypothetical protein